MASDRYLLPAGITGNDATMATGWREDASDAHPSPRPLLALFLFALAIRCCGLLWGGSTPDENMHYPARLLTGQLVFKHHFYPPLYHYLHAISFAIMFAIGRLLGVWTRAHAPDFSGIWASTLNK